MIMKKFVIISAFAAMLLSVSCEKTPLPKDENQIEFDFTVERQDLSDGLKSVKTSWTNGDKVYVFFDSHYASADDMLVMSYDGSKWTYTPGANVTGNLLSSGGSLAAIYSSKTPSITFSGYPLYPSLDITNAGSSIILMATAVSYTYADSKITASISLTVNTNLHNAQITVTGLTGDGWFLKESSEGIGAPSKFYYTGSDWAQDSAEGSFSGWGGNLYLGQLGDAHTTMVYVLSWAQSARTRTFILSNGTNYYKKSFSSKALYSGTAAKFAGPNDLDNPTNGWTKYTYPTDFTISGNVSDEDF